MYGNSFIDRMQEANRGLYDLPARDLEPPADRELGFILCACGCGEYIEEGDLCVELDGDIYAFADHVIRALGGKEGRLYLGSDGRAYVQETWY